MIINMSGRLKLKGRKHRVTRTHPGEKRITNRRQTALVVAGGPADTAECD